MTAPTSSEAKMSDQEVVVIAKCVDCKTRREIRAGEVDPDLGVPFCDCGGVMVADKAKTRRRR